MGDKVVGVFATIVTAVAAVAIITHPQTRGTVRALGGTFVGSLREIVHAAGR
jgi:hypothetical protein